LAQRKLANAEADLKRAKEEAGRATKEAEQAKADAKDALVVVSIKRLELQHCQRRQAALNALPPFPFQAPGCCPAGELVEVFRITPLSEFRACTNSGLHQRDGS
jgi:hypothetical protein